MTLFGGDAAKPFDDLHNIIASLTVSARMLAELWAIDAKSYPPEKLDELTANITKHEDIFWWTPYDQIEIQTAGALAQMEQTCKRIIGAKGTLYSAINWRLPAIMKKKNNNES